MLIKQHEGEIEVVKSELQRQTDRVHELDEEIAQYQDYDWANEDAEIPEEDIHAYAAEECRRLQAVKAGKDFHKPKVFNLDIDDNEPKVEFSFGASAKTTNESAPSFFPPVPKTIAAGNREQRKSEATSSSTTAAGNREHQSQSSMPENQVIDETASDQFDKASGMQTPGVSVIHPEQNYGSQKQVSEKISIGGWPTIKTFRFWKLSFKKAVASASRFPEEAFTWISEVDKAKSFEDLEDSGKFSQLDSLLATEWEKILTGNMKSKLRTKEIEASRQGKMVKGRQITFMVYHKFRMSELDSAMLQWDALVSVELKNDNVQQFFEDWDQTILDIGNLPDAAFLESLFRKQLEKAPSLKQTLAFYYQDWTQNGIEKDYERLREIVENYLDENLLRKNQANYQNKNFQGGAVQAKVREEVKEKVKVKAKIRHLNQKLASADNGQNLVDAAAATSALGLPATRRKTKEVEEGALAELRVRIRIGNRIVGEPGSRRQIKSLNPGVSPLLVRKTGPRASITSRESVRRATRATTGIHLSVATF